MAQETAGAKRAADIGALLRARNACLWVVTPEEGRAKRHIKEVAVGAKALYREWTCAEGVTDLAGQEVGPGRAGGDPAGVLNTIRDSKERAVWLLCDMHLWLKDMMVQRSLRSLAQALPASPRNEARTIIILAPTADIPPELVDHVTVVQWTLPDRPEISKIFDDAISCLSGTPEKFEAAKLVKEAAVEAAVGLSENAAASCYALSLVTEGGKIVPSIVAEEKKRSFSGKGLQWFNPHPLGLDAIGGLHPLKSWAVVRQSAFTQRARDFGLPMPKGVFLVGVSGCGKSLVAKALATAWGVPLLKGDLNDAKDKWVGGSEANIRRLFALAEKVGRCVLWLDEVEKMLGGATQGAADGGVSSDALGVFLTWMQERSGQVFVVATANDVSQLPPELLRKGRFDEMFFVDLPTTTERCEILKVTLAQLPPERLTTHLNINKIAAACLDFTGSEVAAIVTEGLHAAFFDGERDLTDEDLLAAAAAIVPLAKTSPEKVEGLRKWAKGRARPSSLPEVADATSGNRNLDL
jgi:hypothetical protein